MKRNIQKVALFGTSADPPSNGHKKIIGKLAAKEILERSMINNLEPFKNIQQIIYKEPEILCSSKYFINSQKFNRDYSIFIP